MKLLEDMTDSEILEFLVSRRMDEEVEDEDDFGVVDIQRYVEDNFAEGTGSNLLGPIVRHWRNIMSALGCMMDDIPGVAGCTVIELHTAIIEAIKTQEAK